VDIQLSIPRKVDDLIVSEMESCLRAVVVEKIACLERNQGT
jgi:hypothetical protein